MITACTAKPPPPEVEPPRRTAEVAAVTESANTPAPRAADPREAALSATIVQLLEAEHLLRKKIDDVVSRAAFDTYIDRLDPTKLFLLRADRDALARHADKIDDQLRSGSLDLAHDGAKIYAQRVAAVDKLVQELLSKPFDHTDSEFIELDPKKVEPAANENDLRDRWRRRLELEVLERVAQMEARLNPPKKPGKGNANGSTDKDKDKDKDKDDDDDRITPLKSIPKTAEGRDAKARADLAKQYSGRFARLRTPGPLDAAADVINAVASVLDPHTTYMPPADKANFDIRMTGSLEGIGAVLRERDHYIEVSDIVPGGASWRHGGIQAGDLILAVQQEGQEPVDVVDMRIDEVVKMIRGKKGTVVRLRIQKPTGSEETVAITRDVVVIEEAYARGAILSRDKKGPQFGYIHLPSFYGGRNAGQRTAARDVGKLLAEMKKRKVAGVVLDIRGNGGGLLGDAVDITGHLIDAGPVVQVQDSRGKREVHADDQRGVEFDKPVIVLVDRFSASASEILAGALQDYNRAIIVGTGPTHGKGTVQTIADLDRAVGNKIELGVVKITIQQFFRVNGSSTQREGVTPDILLPDPAGHVETGERELEHAISWSQIDPAPHGNWAATWRKELLVQRSAARVAKHPVLAKIANATKVLKARRQDTRIPLARPVWEQRRKDQRAAIDAASPDLKKVPIRLTVKTLDDGSPPPPPPPNGGKPDDRLAKWRDSLARDPWVDECFDILNDMK